MKKNLVIAFVVCAVIVVLWHSSPLQTPSIIPLDEQPADMMCD